METYTVYILRSACGRHFYTGFTKNLPRRIHHHNIGGNPHTSKYRPWMLKTAIQFTDREQPLNFERYLKTATGRAFAKKRL
jgi:putative endonuclease